MPEGIQTEGWLAIFSRISRSSSSSGSAASTPSTAGAASGPRRKPSQISRSMSFGRQTSVVAAVGLDHQPGAGLGEAGEVVEVAAVAIRVVVVAVALALGRGRHDRHAAAVAAQHVGEAGAPRPVRFEAGIPVHAPHCSGRAQRRRSIFATLAGFVIHSHGKHIMEYRRLGPSGLQVSELSLGSWVTYHNQVDTAAAREMLAAAMDAGVNFFDNAEVYAKGQSEIVMGEAFKALALAAPQLRRLDQVLLGPRPRRPGRQPQGHAQPQVPDAGDRRLAQAPAARLRRPGLLPPARPEHADRGDGLGDERHHRAAARRSTGARASGRRPRSARPGTIAERHHLHKPVMEQPQYHLFHRQRVEQEYAPLYDDIGLGLTTWSPLASGLLTGKYRSGMPAGSRGALESMSFLAERPHRPGEERRGRQARADRRRARRERRAAGDRLGGEEPARLDA